MSIVFLFLGCFLLYGKSKHFPEHFNKIGTMIKDNQRVTTIGGFLLLLFSYVLLANQFGWGTGLAIYLIAISFVYSLLLIILPIHKNYLYVIALLSVLLIVIENIL